MIEAIRITISAYTASFRVPHFVGHQLTLTVPPLSTVYGLISAAVGRWVSPEEVEWLAYRCEYESKAMDTEAILTVERPSPSDFARFVTRNVLPREFLVMPRLTLYLPPEWESVFRCPRYSLLLGRTQDVATVEDLKPATLEPVPAGVVSGVLLPFELVAKGNVSAWLQNLPVAFTDEPTRQPLRTQIFGIVDAHRPGEVRDANGWLAMDVENNTVVPIFRKEWVLHGTT
jgi:CRISPR-associated protein Cas5, Tneap subtype